MSDKSTRILVTGAAGVLGRSLCPALEQAGFEVHGLDRRWAAHQDLLTSDCVKDLNSCRGVIHLAGCSRVAWAEADPARAWRDNVAATGALLDALAARGNSPWLIFASSREVYGRLEQLPASESTPGRPANIYGATKAEAEGLIAQARSAGLSAVTLRLTNLYGSNQDHPDRLVPAFVAAAREGRPLLVRGPRRTLDLLHIDDAVAAILATVHRLQAGEIGPSTLNICSGRAITLGELAATIVRLGASNSALRTLDAPCHEVDAFVGDPSAAWRALGWTPRFHLDEGLVRLLATPSPSRLPLDQQAMP